MISNDQIQPNAARGFSCTKSANPGIDADHQTDAIGRGTLDDIVFHSVAVSNAVGNVKLRTSTDDLNGFFENDDRGSAVDVVIAVDQNALAIRNRRLNTYYGFVHPLHQVRRVQMLELRIEKLLRSIGVLYAASDQQPGGE